MTNNITAVEACAFEFPDDQGKNYGKEDFSLHSRVAEVVGDQLGRVFYDDANDEWLIQPSQLRGMVLTNILQEGGQSMQEYPIYGSAIAFEPGVWNTSDGLDEGVTYPAASEACIQDISYCTDEAASINNLQVTQLPKNDGGLPIYSPFAFRGPPDEDVYANCSRAQPQFCPTMDIAFTYDYANVTTPEAEWYNAPRCLYLRDGITTGYWTSPYFDSGAGGINMVTYSQPIISRLGKFLGVATIDVTVDALCYGDQCNEPVDYNYLTSIRPAGLAMCAIAMALAVACGVWTQLHRKHRVVIASQPFFLGIICIGCLIMASSIIPLSFDDSIASTEGCSIACMAFPWLLSIGFTTTFAALFSKVWRLNQVISNSMQMRRVAVKEKDVILPFVVLMTANVAVLLAWTIVDPLKWVRTNPDTQYQSNGYCESEGQSAWKFLIPLGLLNGLALVMANVQAFRARNISTEYSESSYIMFAMVSLLQSLIIGVPLLIIVNDNEVARYFVWCGIIFIVTTSILGVMFIPKVLQKRKISSRGSTSGAPSGYTS